MGREGGPRGRPALGRLCPWAGSGGWCPVWAVVEIGDEYAAGRALVELGHQLLHDAMTAAAANESDWQRSRP